MRIQSQPAFGEVYKQKPPLGDPVDFTEKGQTYWVINGPADDDKDRFVRAREAFAAVEPKGPKHYQAEMLALKGLKTELMNKAK